MIKINQFLEIRLINGLYHLVEKQSELIIEVTFDLEQLAEKIIQYHLFYLENKNSISLENLIKEIRELKEVIKNESTSTRKNA